MGVKMNKAVVTGANGFVGSHVCKELADSNTKIYAVIKDENENIDSIKDLQGISIVYCDLDNIESLSEIITDNDIDVFYHFAWVGSAGNLRCDENIQLKNALWTAQALRTADKMGCKKFVNAGSIMEKETYTAVYTQGSTPGLPYIYGAGKLIAHAICKPIANSLNIDLCWAVITNAYGAGEFSPRFVNTTIRKIIAGEPLQFTAATQNYDFIYIDDVAKAFVAIGEYGKANKEYTIGSGNARPLKEFIIEMQQSLAPDAKPIFGDVPFTGVNMPLEAFDTTDIQTDCHFKPSISFAKGTKLTMDWIKTVN
jgi:nucleoside-diphosphate-sugar epimerase